MSFVFLFTSKQIIKVYSSQPNCEFMIIFGFKFEKMDSVKWSDSSCDSVSLSGWAGCMLQDGDDEIMGGGDKIRRIEESAG